MLKTSALVLVLVSGLAVPLARPTAAAAQAAPAPQPAPIPPPPDVAASPADAAKLPNGLAYRVLAPAREERQPARTDVVTVHYTGWSADGKTIDSTTWRGKPATFLLDRAMPGWTEGVQTMGVGEKRRWWMPEALAYRGVAGRPRGTVVFDIELVDAQPSPFIAPPDVAAPPADARTTPSGIAYKVLRPGPVGEHPRASSRVRVHYTGWTTDGKMFDSSVLRGEPATLGLGDVIQGWTEGVQMMTVGEKVRFWIPENLAYKGQAGEPKGLLVFDIELVGIEH